MPYGPSRPSVLQILGWGLMIGVGSLPVVLFVVVFVAYLLAGEQGIDQALPF